MFARAGYAQAPFAGTTLPAPNIGSLPPPIPGDSATFTYASSLAMYPWAYPSWAGGYPPTTYPGGGVLATPYPATGVMQVRAWWPSATSIQITRITPDGARTPVRGAFPIVLTANDTRRNYCTNPSIEAGANGYVPDAGTPTLTQLADASAPDGAYVLRATVAGAGSNGVTVPTSMSTPTSGQPVTVGWGMRTSARPTTFTLSIGWTNISGGALATTTATLTDDQINASVNTFARQVLTVVPPSGAVTPTVKLIAGGMPAGGTMDLDAITVEVGNTGGSYIDGDTLGAVWLGTPDLSASLVAAVQTILDGECPLDTIVTYQVSFPGITGGRVVSGPVVLSSNYQSWLTHPLWSGAPVKVQLTAVPELEREVEQGVFLAIGASKPKVVTSARRQAPVGTMEFVALSYAERDAILRLFDIPQPVLFRAPVLYGFSAPMWLAVGKVTESRGERKAWQDAVVITADVTEVDAPPVL